MLTNRAALIGAAVSILVSACGGSEEQSVSNDSISQDLAGSPAINRELAAARAATAKYHDVKVAESEGYIPTSGCVASPAGTMGIHYVKPALFGDPALDIEQPEALLYLPTKSGGLRLVAIEYLHMAVVDGIPYFGDTPPQVEVPSLFGQTLIGPMPGHEPGMPWHSELHVWIWSHNPDGVFAEFNPSISCPE